VAGSGGGGTGSGAAAPPLVTAAGEVGALPAGFGDGQSAAEVFALGGSVHALMDQINAVGVWKREEEAAAVEAARLRAQAVRIEAAKQHNALQQFLVKVFSIDPVRKALFDNLTFVEITRLERCATTRRAGPGRPSWRWACATRRACPCRRCGRA